MKITRLGLNTLDKVIKAKNKASFSLKKIHTQSEKYKKKTVLLPKEKAHKCWIDCKGNCAPFRYGMINNDLCKICPGRAFIK